MKITELKAKAGYLLLLFVVSGCFGSDYTYDKRLTGQWYLAAFLEQANMAILYPYKRYSGTEWVPPCVYEAEWNKQFIIAKVHPYQFGERPNKQVTKYYLLEIKDPTPQRYAFDSVTELNKKKQELRIPVHLENHQVFEELK